MKPTKKILFVLLGLILLSSNGCWDRRELESLGFVMSLGLDPGPDGKSVTTTTMIAIPARIAGGGQGGGGGGGGGEAAGTLVMTMNAPTIYEAFNRINTVVNREITLNQNLTILIGEDLAKEGIGKWMDTLIRFREMRRTMLVFICRGKAAEFMNFKPQLEKNPSEYFADLVRLSPVNGMFPVVLLNDFIMRYEGFYQENYAPVLAKYQPEAPASGASDQSKEGAQGKEPPPPSEGGASSGGGEQARPEIKDVRLIGTAVFKGNQMVGTFDNYESQALLLLTGNFREAMLTLPDPRVKNHYIAFRLIQAAPPGIKYRRLGMRDHFQAKLNLEADLVSIQSGINYTTPRMEGQLERLIEKMIENRLAQVIRKAQQRYQSDVFGFGKKVRQTFLTIRDWEEYHWPERFPEAEIQVSVQANIRRVGVEMQPPQSSQTK